jgi:hypothetical protein
MVLHGSSVEPAPRTLGGGFVLHDQHPRRSFFQLRGSSGDDGPRGVTGEEPCLVMTKSDVREYEVGDFFQVEYGQRVEDKAEEYFEAEEDAVGRVRRVSSSMSGSSMMIVMGSGDDVVPRDGQ